MGTGTAALSGWTCAWKVLSSAGFCGSGTEASPVGGATGAKWNESGRSSHPVGTAWGTKSRGAGTELAVGASREGAAEPGGRVEDAEVTDCVLTDPLRGAAEPGGRVEDAEVTGCVLTDPPRGAAEPGGRVEDAEVTDCVLTDPLRGAAESGGHVDSSARFCGSANLVALCEASPAGAPGFPSAAGSDTG
jgi:hypothetical protein